MCLKNLAQDILFGKHLALLLEECLLLVALTE